jgi:hypothetical protein
VPRLRHASPKGARRDFSIEVVDPGHLGIVDRVAS